MTRMQVFPTALIVLDFAAAFVCGYDGDVRRAIYWIAAGVLTITVTF